MNLCTELKENFNELKYGKYKRSLYSETGNKRYYYYKKFRNRNGKKATIIMINPSEKLALSEKEGLDSTINNLHSILKKVPITISGEKHYIASYEIINIFPIIDPDPDTVIKGPTDELNNDVLDYVIKKSKIVIPAWGVEDKFNESTKKLLKKIKKQMKGKNIFIITNKYPCHFSPQCTSISRNPEFVEYKFN